MGLTFFVKEYTPDGKAAGFVFPCSNAAKAQELADRLTDRDVEDGVWYPGKWMVL